MAQTVNDNGENGNGKDGLVKEEDMLNEKGTLRELLEDADYTRMMRECRKECTKNSPSRSHVKTLMKKTFPNRRREISRMNKEGMPMMSSVILDWSCFEYGEFVSIYTFHICSELRMIKPPPPPNFLTKCQDLGLFKDYKG